MNQLSKDKSLTVFLILLLAVTLVITWISQTRLSDLTAKNQSLVQENQNLKQSNTRLGEQIAVLEKETKKSDSELAEGILERLLKQKSLTAEQLKADLQKRADLIKHQPVLGGTMYFPESGIRILTDKWVIAEFEDGHILGYALLNYEVKSGKINWTVIDSYIMK